MLIGPTVGRRVWYTPKREAARLAEDPAYLATRYHIKVPTDLDQVEIANASAGVSAEGQVEITPARAALVSCRRCVVGWEHQGELDGDGKAREVAFVGVKSSMGEVVGAMAEDTCRIPPRVRVELLDFIRSLMEVAEEDFKGSASPAG